MSLLDDIKRDREAGGIDAGSRRRHMQRILDMEAALLAAEELAAVALNVDQQLDDGGVIESVHTRLYEALVAYRNATEGQP